VELKIMALVIMKTIVSVSVELEMEMEFLNIPALLVVL
jgi:hypothetical protein